jgi:hypothetical protein
MVASKIGKHGSYRSETRFFWTRHTLSDTKSNTRGIGAAQRWVKSEFDNYAMASGGRLTSY